MTAENKEEGWSSLHGFSVPPPRTAKNIRDMTTRPMNTKPVPFPGTNPEPQPVEETIKDDDDDSKDNPNVRAAPVKEAESEAAEATPPEVWLAESASTQTPVPAASDTYVKFVGNQRIKVEWQGCQFQVVFDDVWTQKDENSGDVRWLMLVHDLASKPEGPSWNPPVSSSDAVALTISHNSTDYVCSYFGMTLFIPACNLNLMVFLVTQTVEST